MVSPPTLDGLLAWLDAAPNRERTGNFAGLHTQAMARVLAHLPTPPSPVTIAGTKGKGSTCEMVATCLEACGYTVGCYTSPHILDVRERLRINRSLISESAFVGLTKRVASVAQEMEAEHGPATFFELTTAMALLHIPPCSNHWIIACKRSRATSNTIIKQLVETRRLHVILQDATRIRR